MSYVLAERCIDYWEAHPGIFRSPRIKDVVPILLDRLGSPYQISRALNCNSYSIRWWLLQNGYKTEGNKWIRDADYQKPKKTGKRSYRKRQSG